MTRLARRAFDHRADLLAAVVYACLAFLSFNALADYANGHHLFPEPAGGWAFAVAIDGSVLYAFISFRRAQVMAGVLLVIGAAATYMLQRWHAQDALHPLLVAGVVPGLMILVTFAWHQIREAEARPDWPPPQPPTKEPEPEDAPADAPVRTRRHRALTSAELVKVEPLISQRKAAYGIARELGIPYPVVRQHMRDQELVSSNGQAGGS